MGVVRNQSIRNSISFYIGMAIGALNTIIVYPNVFNEHPEHYGLIQILVAYSIIIATFSTLGIPKAIIKFFPGIKEKGQLYFLSLIVSLSGFFFLLLLYLFSKDYILSIINASELLQDNFFYIIVLVLFISFFDVLTAISRSFLDSSTPIFINEVFLKTFSLIILLLHWISIIDFTLFLQLYISGYILKFLILFILQFVHDRLIITYSLEKIPLNKILSFGIYVVAGGASLIIVSRLDMIMLGSLLSLEQVAFYSVAFYIGNAIRVPGKSIATISAPLIAKAWQNKDIEAIDVLYTKTSINQLIVGGVFFLCIWLNIDDIFSLLPEKFQGGKWVVFFIGLSQLFNITTGINGLIIVNSVYYRYELFTNIFLVIFTFIANYIFITCDWSIFGISISGINGAALGTALSVLLFNTIRLLLIKFKIGIQPFTYSTFYSIIIFIIIYLVVNAIPLSSLYFVNIFIRCILVVIFFIPLLFLFNLSDDITSFIIELKKKYFY